MAVTGHHAPNVPPAVSAWLAAHALHDVDAELAQLTDDVVLVDGGREYRGRDAVREWAAGVGTTFEHTAAILSTDNHGDAVVATARVERDLPGSPVDLRYQFLLTDGLISALTIHL
jgi:ketosteroid isomerase-like protein